MADRFETDLVLVPSSMHEFIILRYNDESEILNNIDELKKIVYDVNKDHVACCDVLSDNVYYYDRDSKEVTIM